MTENETETIDLYVTKIESDYDWDLEQPLVRVFGRTEGGYADEVTVRGFYPYFYVEPGHGVSASDHEDLVEIEPEAESSLWDEPLDKVTYRKPWNKTLYEIKDLFETDTYETDIDFENRFRVDLDVYTGIRVPSRECFADEVEPIEFTEDLRIVTFDIETDDRGDGFPQPGEARILGIVAHDNYSDETVAFYDLDGDSFEDRFGTGVPESLTEGDLDLGDLDGFVFEPDEKAMLRKFADYITEIDPDVLTAWNVGFDAPHVVARMDEIGVNSDRLSRVGRSFLMKNGDAVIAGRTCYDLLYAYKKAQLKELASYKLDAVAEAELGHKKVEHTGLGYYDMYAEEPELFVRYNVVDVDLAVGIDESAGVFDFKQALRHEVGLELSDTVDNHSMIEMFARRKLYEKGVVAPDAKHPDVEEYDGAVVFQPYTGLTTNVTGVDLASLYPNTMAMFNMSPETKVEVPEAFDDAPPGRVSDMMGVPLARVETPDGNVWFRLDEPGIFAELVDDAIGLKAEYKEKKNSATGAEREALSIKYDASKAVTNSLYGVLGWRHFFLYDREVALSITSAGVECITETKRYISEETDGEVIYGDTDSNYVKWPDEWDRDRVLEEAIGACETLNDEVYPAFGSEFGVPPWLNRWEIECESYAKTYFQHGKKKRYAMHITWDEGKDVDKKKVTGYKRSDVCEVTAELIDKTLENIVHGLDESEVSAFLMEAATEIQPEGADLERLGIPEGMGKEIGDGTQTGDGYYAWTNGTPKGAHPRGAYFSNELFGTEFSEGSKPKRVYVKPFTAEVDGEAVEVDVLCFDTGDDLPDDVVLDVQRMEETAILSPLRPILHAADVDINAAIRGQTQTGLSQFMGA